MIEFEIRFYVKRHLSGELLPVLEFENPKDFLAIHGKAYESLKDFLEFFRWLLNEKA